MTDAKVMTREHELKCWPAAFQAMKRGEKTFEWRRDDRGFNVGDTLWLREYDPQAGEGGRYSGDQLRVVVTYVLRDKFDLPPGYCVLGVRTPTDAVATLAEANRALRARAETAEREVTRLSELLWGARCVYCEQVIGQDRQNQDIADEVLRRHVLACTKHPATQLRAERDALREALVKVIAHTARLPGPNSNELLNGLLDSCARIARAAISSGEGAE
jgi:hypothetical protein